MRIVAKVLGQLLIAISALWGAFCVGMLVTGDYTAALGAGALAGVFALPGGLLHAYARTAERRQEAERLIRSRERFTIEEVAGALRVTPEQAHAFIAQQIAEHQLDLAYQEQTRGYARRALPARPAEPPPPPPPGPAQEIASEPCPTCGSLAAPTEAGFCPTCGARAEPSRAPRVRS